MALRAIGWAGLLSATLVLPSAAADLTLAPVADTTADDALKFETKVLLMSDYIYRGVSLSQHRPSAAVSGEVEWHGIYAGANVQSVDLPTQPAAEITWSAGYRWTMAGFDMDVGANYFWYPREILADGQPATSYVEYALEADRDITDQVTLKGVLAYSPNISGTGAWGAYAEARAEIDLPTFVTDIEWQLNAAVGYWRFGNTSPALGGFPLPAYTNWLVGLEFTFRKHLVLDLTYSDTNLSKENCFVFTGDPLATPGGVPDPVSNPDGLRSRLCGATLVGTLTVRLDQSDFKK
jgi:uncharacterized protein (TIGR02001 family)